MVARARTDLYNLFSGWDPVARMKATFVIDAIAVDMSIIKPSRERVVPIGGIAHAGQTRVHGTLVDGNGAARIEAEASPEPSSASGSHMSHPPTRIRGEPPPRPAVAFLGPTAPGSRDLTSPH